MTRTRALVGMLVLVISTMGLTSCEHSGSKSGGTAEPVVLTLADGYSDPSFEPAGTLGVAVRVTGLAGVVTIGADALTEELPFLGGEVVVEP